MKKVTTMLRIVISTEAFGNNLFRIKRGVAIRILDTNNPPIKNKVAHIQLPALPLAVNTI